MQNIAIKPDNYQELTMEDLQSLFGEREYKYFIQFFLEENNKGENGMLVKEIRNTLLEEEEDFVEEQINFFNNNARGITLWEKSVSQILDEFYQYPNRYMRQRIREDRLAVMFVLLTLNYVFVSYKDRQFRKGLGLKKRSFLKPFKL